MISPNRMRIICDPYKKEIEYYWYDSNLEDYREFDPENSKLARDELMNATIQNRAQEIVDNINNECNVGNTGLDIVFIGTQSDYEYLCKVIDTYYRGCNIKCLKDNDYYFNSASDVMPAIKDTFTKVKSTLDEYTEEDIARLIDKYNDVVKPSISLCVIGLYSAGKSSFINSIIGAEVLPSESDPTTAKVCKISHAERYEIRFKFDSKECVLTFKGNDYKPNSSSEMDIIKKLQSVVKSGKQHDEVYHMNVALSVINSYKNNKHTINGAIEIKIPFRKTGLPVKEFDFIIYDTPGSNSTSNEEHFEVLSSSLDEQTNALPIYITTLDSTDATDNDALLDLIKKTGTSLDTTNTIVIINKADEKGKKALKDKRDKCQDSSVTKWKSTRIFFVSSLIGIASKKNDPDDPKQWLDEDLKEIYDEKKSRYAEDERKLYEYNIIDKSKADKIKGYDDDKLTTHLYKNSGLESVEKEIVDYAEKYALYNKCHQGSIYLQKAIDKCAENVHEVEKQLDSVRVEAEKRFDRKKSELLNKLLVQKFSIASYNTQFQGKMEQIFASYTKEKHLVKDDEELLRNGLQKRWKEYKEEEKKDKDKKKRKWALSQIQNYVDKMFDDYLREFSIKTNKSIEEFWNRSSEDFKTKCIQIVHDSDALTVEQKNLLEHIVLSINKMSMEKIDFDLREMKAIRPKKFLFWELQSEKFDVYDCADILIEKFHNEVSVRINSTTSRNEKYFKNWVDKLINRLKDEMCTFNADLEANRKQIEGLKEEIALKKECIAILEENQEYIEGILKIQEGKGTGFILVN